MKKAFLLFGALFLSLVLATELDLGAEDTLEAVLIEAESRVAVRNGAPKPPAQAVAAADKVKDKLKGKGKQKKKDKTIKYKSVKVESALPWREIEFSAVAPTKRQGHSLTMVKNKLYIFGGCFLDEVCYNDMRIYDTVKDEWKEVSKVESGLIPSERGHHSASLVGDKRIVLFGGSANEMYRSDVFVFDTDTLTWVKPATTGTAPSARSGHAAAVWKTRVFIFGGYTPDGYVNDLHVLDTSLMAWARPPVSGEFPSPRSGHSLTVFSQTEMSMLLPSPNPLDKNIKNTKDGKKTPPPPPPPNKKKPKLVQTERMLLFGGASDAGVLNDVWVFDAALMAWQRPSTNGQGPTPRHNHVASAYQNYIFVNGGCDIRNLACYNDTYVLNCDSLEWGAPTYSVKIKTPYVVGSADDDDLIARMKKKPVPVLATVPETKPSTPAKPRFAEEEDDEEDEMEDGEEDEEEDEWDEEEEEEERRNLAKSQGAEAPPRFAQTQQKQQTSQTNQQQQQQQHNFQQQQQQRQDQYDEEEEEEDEYDEEEEEDEEGEEEELVQEARFQSQSQSQTQSQSQQTDKKDKKDNKKVTAATTTNSKDKNRKKRQRHSDNSKGGPNEDRIKELAARGGHAAAFVKQKLYLFGGCFLEQKCSFDLVYMHVPKTFHVTGQQVPLYENGQVIAALPKTAVLSPPRPLAIRPQKQKKSTKTKPTPKNLKIGKNNVGFSFRQIDGEDETHPSSLLESSQSEKDSGRHKVTVTPFEGAENNSVYHSKLFWPITISVIFICVGGVCLLVVRNHLKQQEKDERERASLTGGFLSDKKARDAFERDLENQTQPAEESQAHPEEHDH